MKNLPEPKPIYVTTQQHIRRKSSHPPRVNQLLTKLDKLNLTPKQDIFTDAYLDGHNLTKAALQAGYSKKTAYYAGSSNLKKQQIVQAIEIKQELRTLHQGVTPDWVLKRYRQLVDYDIDEIFTNDWDVKKPSRMPRGVRFAIQGVKKITRGTGKRKNVTVEVKLADKRQVLDSLAKTLGMFTEKIEHSMDENIISKLISYFNDDDANRIRMAMIEMYQKKGNNQ